MVEFRVLGPVEVVHAGGPVDLGGPRHRRLLAMMVLHAGEVVPTGRLLHGLWGDVPPRSAPAMLHVRISQLRAALRPAGVELVNRDGGYLLRADPDDVDARRFERLAAEGAALLAAGDPASARSRLGSGLALWRGPALAEFLDAPFARTELSRLAELRLGAIENRIAADLDLGRHGELVAEVEALVAEHPLRERFRGQLMLALYRAGRQGEALRAYRDGRRLLADQLGVDPGADLRRLHAAMLRQDPDLELPAPATAAGRGNLPAASTSFVGRRGDVAEISDLLRAHRMVTLTGVGGSGKSRLAVEVAAACRADFPDGAWLVELAALPPRAGLVGSAVAATLGVREHPRRPLVEVLAGHIGRAGMLLVLDNCEHVVDEVAQAADRLLRACAGLRILATSRERLGHTGEAVRPVPGLGVPDPGVVGVDAVGRADAVRLFVDRATATRPGFALTGADAARVAEICRRLDGLPLALELAAAGARVWGVDRIAARLDDPYEVLIRGSRAGPARHRTMRAVVDWSYGLLDAPQQRLFQRLAVFADGFTLDAAEAVCGPRGGDPPVCGPTGGDPPVADALAELVDKSLVAVEHSRGTQPRYRMLETLRAYAAEKLERSGTAAGVRDRHAAAVLAMVRQTRRALRDGDEAAWLHRLESELGNIRAALGWALTRGDAATAVRLAGSLYPLWDRHGHYREGREWLGRALGLRTPVPPAVRARAMDSLAGLAMLQGDLEAAGGAAREAAVLGRLAGDRIGVARALLTSGLVALYADDTGRAAEVLDEASRTAEGAGDQWPAALARLYLACVAAARGDPDRVVAELSRCEPALRAVGDQEGVAAALTLRAWAALRTGEHDAATAGLHRAVAAFRSLGHRWALSIVFIVAAEHAGAHGHHVRAVSLLGAAEAIRESVGAAAMPFVTALADGVSARALQARDATTVERARRAGRGMSPRRALAGAVWDCRGEVAG